MVFRPSNYKKSPSQIKKLMKSKKVKQKLN